MAEIQPVIENGVKIYNVTKDKIADFERLYSDKIRVLKDKIESSRGGRPLEPPEISALRDHPELGVWVIDGKPVRVKSLNQIVKGRGKVKFQVPGVKKGLQYLTRSFLEQWPRGAEVPTSASAALRKRVKGLKAISKLQTQLGNNEITEQLFHSKMTDIIGKNYNPSKVYGLGPGQTLKAWKQSVLDSYNRMIDLNQAFEAKHGFKFDVGHIWQALGNPGERGINDALFGGRVEGKFTPQNIAPQPKFTNFDHPFWSQIQANVPHKQTESLRDLSDVYVGGLGWSGSLDDYMMSGDKNYFKLGDLDPKLRSYVAFGRSGTPQSRLAQVENFRDFQSSFGGTQTEFFKFLTDKGEYIPPTIEEGLKKASEAAIPKGGQSIFEGPNILDNTEAAIPRGGLQLSKIFNKDSISAIRAQHYVNNINEAVGNVKAPGLRSVLPAVGIGLNLLNLQSKTEAYEEDPTPSRWVQKQAARAETALEATEVATLGATAPITTPLQLGLGALDFGIDYTREGRQRGDAQLSMLGGGIPGTKDYDKYAVHGLFEKDSDTEQLLMKTTVNQENKESGEENPIETSLPVLNQF